MEMLFLEVGNDYLELLRHPAHGFGKNYNPCIDCHAFMLRKAGEMLSPLGASFLITGEVLGQRPMSQNRNALYQVEKASGMVGMIVRPLSALKLEQTIPEQNGWIDRSQLLDIHGRGRNRQIQLAEKLGVKDYPTPAGGCLLTQESTAKRIKKYFEFRPDLQNLQELNILKAGRHFYLDEKTLLVIGRNQNDNALLAQVSYPTDYYLKVATHPGPLALLRSSQQVSHLAFQQAARIVARYSDAKNDPQVSIKVFNHHMEVTNQLTIAPYKPEEIPPYIS